MAKARVMWVWVVVAAMAVAIGCEGEAGEAEDPPFGFADDPSAGDSNHDAGPGPAPSPGAMPGVGNGTPSDPAPSGPGPAAPDPGAGPDPVADAAVPADAGPGGDVDTGTEDPVDPFSSDRALFFGDSRCDRLDALFCDGFEDDSLAAAWSKQGPGSASLSGDETARGSGALHVHTEGNGFAYLRLSSVFPLAQNRYYARMFVRFDALPTAPTWAHWTIAEAAGSGDGSLIRVGGQLDRSHNRFGVGSDRGPTGDWTRLDEDTGSDVNVPEDEWLCVEWLHDGTADESRFYWDGVEHPSLTATASDHGGNDVPYLMPDFESVWIGWWLYQGNPTPGAYDVWIDEVAFDDERIGCVR